MKKKGSQQIDKMCFFKLSFYPVSHFVSNQIIFNIILYFLKINNDKDFNFMSHRITDTDSVMSFK